MSDAASTLKKVACDAIDAAAADLAALSMDIWKHPELNYEERHAHQALADFLEKYGLQTERSYKLDTAFKATHGTRSNGPNVTFISEYDALPEIGHACGHNLIAEVGVGAGIGLMAAMKASGKQLGQVTVMGTPAEEGGGGKIKLIDAGAFNDVDIAMMSHPFPDNSARPDCLAVKIFEVVYSGKASHAAGYPWEGVNALDAAVMCYQGLSCLRQQMKPRWRLHCVILEGGVKVNIIPERTKLHVAIRAPTDSELHQLQTKIMNIIQSAATATGCQVEHKVETNYSSMLVNDPLATAYDDNLSQVQLEQVPTHHANAPGSTDMGNVAHVVPSIHPMFYIGGKGVNHTREFTDDAGKSRAQVYTLYQAKALAMTGIDIMLNGDLLDKIRTDFKQGIARETQ